MKHKTLTVFIAILVFSLAMTIISVKNYVSSLNTVSVTDSYSGSLRTDTAITGFVHFVTTVSIDLPEQCGIDEVLVSLGDEVKVGDPLLQLHYDDLVLCRLQLLLDKEQMKGQGGLTSIEKEIAELKEKKIDEQLEALEVLIEADGFLNSPIRAQVVGLPGMDGKIELGIYDDGVYCSWEVPKSSYRESATFSGVVSKSKTEFSVADVSFDAAKAVYQYQSKPFNISGLISTTMPVDVTMVYVSGEYRAVLPKQCIRKDNDGSSFVYVVQERSTVYGTERYLYKTGITIMEQNDYYVAIMAGLSDVVEYAFNTPVNLEAVRVIK